MIEITELTKTFNAGQVNELRALQDIDLHIPDATFLVIVGANGSGKSTLLNSIAGSIFPDRGELKIDGFRITSLPEHRRSKWIARVFQNPLSGTAADLSILENFRLAALRTGRKGLRIGINEGFKRTVREKIATLDMGLEDKLLQPMGTLSGGQRQALTLLMAVMDNLKIVLLDEPTAALDPRSAEVVMKTAARLIQEHKITAILVTHNMKDAFEYGNQLVQMAEGRILRDLNKEQKEQLTVTDLYQWFL